MWLAAVLAWGLATPVVARSGPSSLASTSADRAAIAQVLTTYIQAVHTRDQALFESTLLGRDIPFDYIDAVVPPDLTSASIRMYEPFRKGVFEGKSVSRKSFDHVRIEQDGGLAQVSLLFRNRGAGGDSWGWKTVQLLKVAGKWKIASEFFTMHDGAGPDRDAAKLVGLTGTSADRAAIRRVLATYTQAISTQDPARFDTLLLDRDIPFAAASPSASATTTVASTRDYEGFRRNVFSGERFAQTFDHVRIEQDGALAQASLIFRNRTPQGPSWGFKAIQLIKVKGAWKIASEFFTGHIGTGPRMS